MKVHVYSQQSDLPIDERSVEPVVQFVLAQEGRRTDECSVYFVSEEEICRLHGMFFDDASPTDCISFPMDGDELVVPHVLGEVFICPKVAIDYVRSHGVGHDAYVETTLYLIHGLLHLLGYRDEEESLREEMHAVQNRYLASVGSLRCS